jgi:hypothetical protein
MVEDHFEREVLEKIVARENGPVLNVEVGEELVIVALGLAFLGGNQDDTLAVDLDV